MIFEKATYAGTRMWRKMTGTQGETITAIFTKKNAMAALVHVPIFKIEMAMSGMGDLQIVQLAALQDRSRETIKTFALDE